MTNNVRLRKERFRQWLQAQKPTAVVGSTRDANQSPVARYIRERSLVSGGRSAAFEAKDGRTYQRSGWVAEFLDTLLTHPSDNITARTALRILGK